MFPAENAIRNPALEWCGIPLEIGKIKAEFKTFADRIGPGIRSEEMQGREQNGRKV